MNTRVKKKLRYCLFFIIAVAGFFLLAEVLVRLLLPPVPRISAFVKPPSQITGRNVSIFKADPQLFWRAKGGMKNTTWDFTLVSTNELGLRYPPLGEKSKNTVRILCVGDSITFGYRVLQKSAYPAILERALASNFPERKWQVIPLACPGYTAFQGYLFFREMRKRLQPDIITVLFGWNDMSPERYADEVVYQRLRRFKGVRGFLWKSRLYSFLRKMLLPVRDAAVGKPGGVPRVGKDGFVKNFARIQGLASKSGAPCVFILPIFQGASKYRKESKDFPVYREALCTFAKKNNIAFVDVPFLTARGFPANKQYFGEPLHPTDTGHYVLAREIFATLLFKDNLLPLKTERLKQVRKHYQSYLKPISLKAIDEPDKSDVKTPSAPTGALEPVTPLSMSGRFVPGAWRELHYRLSFKSPLLERIPVERVGFNWEANGHKPVLPPFSLRWEGYLKAETEKRYDFSVEYTGDAWLFIDGYCIIAPVNRRAGNILTGSVNLKRGFHKVRFQLTHRGYENTCKVNLHLYRRK